MSSLSKNLAVVAMSGGVDSSVAALLLKQQGMDVIGVAMKTHEPAKPDSCGKGGDTALPLYNLPSVSKTCCTASDINDARRVCQLLDIPFYALNFKDEFEEKVIQHFGREYAQGRTPNPCVACNNHLKFDALLRHARQLGAYYLATGHYAQKSRDAGGLYHLLRARDRAKDQTYFLYGLGQEQLEHVLFPVGRHTKEEVREIARKAGLKTADKPESQEICFVPDNDYAGFIENSLPQYRGRPGTFVDAEGKELGEHRGVHAYTLGQRRGLGVAAGDRLYVNEIRPAENVIVLSSREGLLAQGLKAESVQWVHRDGIFSGMDVEVKTRHRHSGVPAVLILDEKEEGGRATRARVEFREPHGPVTPGQIAVFYRGEDVLGGGVIEAGIR